MKAWVVTKARESRRMSWLLKQWGIFWFASKGLSYVKVIFHHTPVTSTDELIKGTYSVCIIGEYALFLLYKGTTNTGHLGPGGRFRSLSHSSVRLGFFTTQFVLQFRYPMAKYLCTAFFKAYIWGVPQSSNWQEKSVTDTQHILQVWSDLQISEAGFKMPLKQSFQTNVFLLPDLFHKTSVMIKMR